jgi:hypothetical protein
MGDPSNISDNVLRKSNLYLKQLAMINQRKYMDLLDGAPGKGII